MALAVSGYSGTPLPAKLGLKDEMIAAFIAKVSAVNGIWSGLKLVIRKDLR
ncbi:hypothetical protein LRP31_04600 [Mesorhizobium mediterraneum]|uniref:hypothetical protein n=1 Tax=Mesorhizobium mediterraneum TaxID=43617 RepID=UPI00142DDB66|nr:hypothetical protein [Mesorhizobium mediterraneum]WIW54528.1 hypothetical protein LRP31_04600 [Mesorhizobium mediterraneum]